MKKYTLILVILFVTLINNSSAYADTLLPSGYTVTTDTHFTKINSPYIVEDYMSIGEGATLTIDPGAIVKMKSRYGAIGVQENSTLKIGSNLSLYKTHITSYQDDTVGGDSNGDGDASLPTKDDWTSLSSSGTLDIQNSVIRYGGQYYNLAMINANGNTNISNSKLEYFGAYAIGAGGTTTIKNSTITNGRYAIKSASGSFKISNSRFENISKNVIIRRYDSRFTDVIDLRNNWWGKPTGPTVTTGTGPYGSALISDIATEQQVLDDNTIIFDPWLTTDPALAPVGCTVDCNSSILFLPGIMGSKLFEQGTFEGNQIDLQRWSSSSDFNQERLRMDTNGYSINNLYTANSTSTNTGVIDEIAGQNIYKSFMGDLAQMKAGSTIQDYSLIPYDWRLPLDQIVAKGREVDGKVYYGSTVPNLNDSFIVKELQRLVTNSKTGKVTIVAHSNGGLVTKELIQELKETNNPLYDKIDKVIFVAVPQVGTPEAVTTMLHGSAIGNIGVSKYSSAKRTRDLFQNMPGMYNLLPTEGYFNNLSPLIEFAGSNPNQANINTYGPTINTYQEYLDYLKGLEGRATPTYSDTISPAKANSVLLQNAIDTHLRLDGWLPATSTKVYQVAGWGIYTPSGLKYTDYKQCVLLDPSTGSCTLSNNKITISDQLKLNGDGTVLSGSAQMMGESSQVENWWVDVRAYNKDGLFNSNINRDHKSILEVDNLRTFIKNIVTGSTSIPQYLSRTEPAVPTSIDGEYTKYQIHSPLHLTVIDSLGNITGYSTSTSQILEQIKGSQYLESADVKTVLLPKDTPHQLLLTAYASGSFTLESSTLNGNDVTQTTVFEAVPTSTSTVAVLTNTGTEVSTSTPLTLDFDGNGTTDKTISTQTGQTAVYDTTPPELQLTFSTSTKDVVLNATDDLDPNPALTIGTSTITLKDSQNNTTVINFKKLKDIPTKLVLIYNSITRNGVATTTPNTRIEYDWKLDNQDRLKDLDTKIVIKGIEKNVFNYKKQTNQTTIKNKNIQTGQVVTTTQSGFVPVTVITNVTNLLNVSY